MMYLHCPRCRLAIKCRSGQLMPSSCPRCLARAALVSPLFGSPLNGVELAARTVNTRRGDSAAATTVTTARSGDGFELRPPAGPNAAPSR